jgi:hypothetical protein
VGVFLDFRTGRVDWGQQQGVGWNREIGFGLTVGLPRWAGQVAEDRPAG